MGSALKFLATLVFVSVALSGCALFDQQLSKSEKELCALVLDIPTMIKSFSGGEKSFNEMKTLTNQLARLENDLSNEKSATAPLVGELRTGTTSLVAALQANRSSYLNLVEEFGLMTSKNLGEISTSFCRNTAADNSEKLLDLTLESIYPEGVWLENADEDFVVYSFQPTTDRHEFEAGVATSLTDLPNWAGLQHSMDILCSRSPKMQSIYLSKSRPDPTESDPDLILKKIPMGPDGPATFEYQLDDNPPQKGKGWIMNSIFFPFMHDKSQKGMTSGAVSFGELIMNSNGVRLQITVSRAGANFEATFFIQNAKSLKPKLQELGCFL